MLILSRQSLKVVLVNKYIELFKSSLLRPVNIEALIKLPLLRLISNRFFAIVYWPNIFRVAMECMNIVSLLAQNSDSALVFVYYFFNFTCIVEVVINL